LKTISLEMAEIWHSPLLSQKCLTLYTHTVTLTPWSNVSFAWKTLNKFGKELCLKWVLQIIFQTKQKKVFKLQTNLKPTAYSFILKLRSLFPKVSFFKTPLEKGSLLHVENSTCLCVYKTFFYVNEADV